MPTGLIDCIVRFFIFYEESGVVDNGALDTLRYSDAVPASRRRIGITMLYSITMRYCITTGILYRTA